MDTPGEMAYSEAESLYRALRGPGSGQISDAAEIHVAPDGRHAVFSGTLMDKLEEEATTRICIISLETGFTRVVSFGPHTDRWPKYSPDGRTIAFVSDRHAVGDFQVYFLDPVTGAARPGARVPGWVEYLQWSPDGKRVLLGVAGHGADVSGGQGAAAQRQKTGSPHSWMPKVETGEEAFRWRHAWIYEIATHRVYQVVATELNIWESVWCGNDAVAAVASPGPNEGLWYSACLFVIDIRDGRSREVLTPTDQLGWPSTSPSGRQIAIVEGCCSDRGLVAGDLRVVDVDSGKVRTVDTKGIDVTCTEWRNDRHLLIAGHRGFETVVATYDADVGEVKQAWASNSITTGGRYVSVSGCGDPGDCVLLGETFVRGPEVAVVRKGKYSSLKTFDLAPEEQAAAIQGVEKITWNAPDGLDIQGWLLLPEEPAQRRLVMAVHGGPVSHWRPTWLGRKYVQLLLLARHGFAIFLPNPRGSAGRGQDFARLVRGDLGGADAKDLLSGLDALVERKMAEPLSLGVTGASYGGFMTSWLITQDPRFAAAVSVCPHTNQITQRLLSNIPEFTDLFLEDKYSNPAGRYFERSPVMHAHRVSTPTLNICGALDKCTPAEEAQQFHNALLENGTQSVLVTYPEEGHGIRKFPATIDYAARVLEWFEAYIPREDPR